jgi:hypothetical protein
VNALERRTGPVGSQSKEAVAFLVFSDHSAWSISSKHSSKLMKEVHTRIEASRVNKAKRQMGMTSANVLGSAYHLPNRAGFFFSSLARETLDRLSIRSVVLQLWYAPITIGHQIPCFGAHMDFQRNIGRNGAP